MFFEKNNNAQSTEDPYQNSPAGHMNNVYFAPYMERCSRIVSIGRLRWFKGSPHTSTDDFCWYFWQQGATSDTQTLFYGR